jgi:hypothetical protein
MPVQVRPETSFSFICPTAVGIALVQNHSVEDNRRFDQQWKAQVCAIIESHGYRQEQLFPLLDDVIRYYRDDVIALFRRVHGSVPDSTDPLFIKFYVLLLGKAPALAYRAQSLRNVIAEIFTLPRIDED